MCWRGTSWRQGPLRGWTRSSIVGVETIVLDEHMGAAALCARQQFLRDALASRSGWRQCERSGSLFAWCRVPGR